MKTFLLTNSENLYLDNDGSMTFEIGLIWKKNIFEMVSYNQNSFNDTLSP